MQPTSEIHASRLHQAIVPGFATTRNQYLLYHPLSWMQAISHLSSMKSDVQGYGFTVGGSITTAIAAILYFGDLFC